jgi:phospholipase C
MLVRGCFLSMVAAALACDAPSDVRPDPEERECSQAHREIARWQGREVADCHPDLTGLLELTTLGNGGLLFQRRFTTRDDLWRMNPDGTFAPEPAIALQIDSNDVTINTETAGMVFLPADQSTGRPPRLLAYDPRSDVWRVYSIDPPSTTSAVGVLSLHTEIQKDGRWPPGLWKGPSPLPWDRQFLGLEDGYLLDRDPGDGSFRIWRLVPAEGGLQLVGPTGLAGGPREEFRRGHRLVHLGPGRLLAWAPCPAGSAAASAPCTGSAYHLWRYSLADDGTPRDPFADTLAHQGIWPEIGAEHTIVAADPQHLAVWSGSAGQLRSYALDPDAPDPLAGQPIGTVTHARLRSVRWEAPTEGSAIKKLVLILQDGRSFDSYFGRYCRTPPRADGLPIDCTLGPDCCEAMPASVPGTSGCTVADPETPGHAPNGTPVCLRAKMNGGAMDAFAAPSPEVGSCGDPRDVACARVDGQAGAVDIYHRLAAGGALADRFFQSYGYTDGDPLAQPPPFDWNLLYLTTARFSPVDSLIDDPVLTKELVRNQVAWAIYAGRVQLTLMEGFGVPIFYDPTWTPFRSLVGAAEGHVGEFDYDLRRGQLPPVSIVIPDRNDDLRCETAGRPFGNGIRFVEGLVNAIAASPHASETLILLTYLTAGGHYDHVRPPPAPPLDVDSTTGNPVDAKAVHYGPRVPLLALGPFARPNHISHVQLELASIVRFIEWNWLSGQGLNIGREPLDVRRYRDTVAKNLGSLIDPALQVPDPQ